MSHSEQFYAKYRTKLIFNVDSYIHTEGPNYYLSSAYEKKIALYQCHLRFKDGTEIRIIYNDDQYRGLKRSKLWNTVLTIKGEGYRKIKVA